MQKKKKQQHTAKPRETEQTATDHQTPSERRRREKKTQVRGRNLGVDAEHGVRIHEEARGQEAETQGEPQTPRRGLGFPQRLREREEKRKHGVDETSHTKEKKRDTYKNRIRVGAWRAQKPYIIPTPETKTRHNQPNDKTKTITKKQTEEPSTSPDICSLQGGGAHGPPCLLLRSKAYTKRKIADITPGTGTRKSGFRGPPRGGGQTPAPHPSCRMTIDLAHQTRTIAIASDFRVDGAKSPEIPQKEGVLGSEIAARNRKSLATFHRTLKSQCSIAFSCLGNRAISEGRNGHRNRKSQKSLRFRCAKAIEPHESTLRWMPMSATLVWHWQNQRQSRARDFRFRRNPDDSLEILADQWIQTSNLILDLSMRAQPLAHSQATISTMFPEHSFSISLLLTIYIYIYIHLSLSQFLCFSFCFWPSWSTAVQKRCSMPIKRAISYSKEDLHGGGAVMGWPRNRQCKFLTSKCYLESPLPIYNHNRLYKDKN